MASPFCVHPWVPTLAVAPFAIMHSASQLLHRHLGSPPHAACADVVAEHLCWLCAAPLQRGQRIDQWQGASFTGQNRVRCPESEYVCEACVYICARLSPVPGRPPKPGKKFGGNFRNYSHLYDDGAEPIYLNASKSEKPAILEWLRTHKRGMWFAAIADSGQKHTLPWAPINPAGARRGLVLFDETVVRLPLTAGWSIVDRMAALLTAGATKEELLRGQYGPRTWLRCRDTIKTFELDWGEIKRGSPWFGLALWLAQRDEDAVRRRLKKDAKNAKAERGAKRKAPHQDRRGAP